MFMRRFLATESLLKIAVAITVCCIALGTLARFSGLENRLFWADEVVTSLRVSGYTIDGMKVRLLDGHAHTVAEVAAYQTPGKDATTANIVGSLAREDAQHPPLYYLCERMWVQMFGNEIRTRRSLSALFSCLALPALYWLSMELFASPLTGCIAVCLASLSPFLEVYAKQAREYSLWELLTICSSAALLRTVKQPRLGHAVFLLISLVMNAYTFLFGVFSTITAWIYVTLRERTLRSKSVVVISCVCILALASFTPWLLQIYLHRDRINEANAWSAQPIPLVYLIAKIALNLGSTFYDLPLMNIKATITAIPLFLLIAAGIWWFSRNAERGAKLFVASLVLPPLLFLLVPDLLTHTHRSSITRYLTPIYLALQLLIAAYLAHMITTKRLALIGICSAVLLLGYEARATTRQMYADIWWDNQTAWPVPQIAAEFRSRPVTLVNEGDWNTLFSLLPALNVNSRLLLGDVSLDAIKPGMYVLSPPDAWRIAAAGRGITLASIALVSPLQHSAHAIASSTLPMTKQAMGNTDATLYLVSRVMKR